MLVNQLKDRLLKSLYGFLKQGITLHKLSLSVAFGVTIGLFPIFGTTTTILLIVALVFRLNVAAMQLVNYALYPVQVVMIYPLIKLGTYIFQVNPLPYTVEEMLNMMQENFFETLEKFWQALLVGAGAWLIFAIPLFALTYYGFYSIFCHFNPSDHWPKPKGSSFNS